MSAAKSTPRWQWYVTDWARRHWFGDDELTARTYLLLMRAAFNLQPGIDLFIGRDVPPPCIAKVTGSAALAKAGSDGMPSVVEAADAGGVAIPRGGQQ